jgi:hypothetical protein
MLNISPELEKQLKQEAERAGLSLDEYAQKLLEERAPSADRQIELVSLIQSWIDEGDEEDQRVLGEYMIRVLDEDRLSDRKLFPPELKGVSW